MTIDQLKKIEEHIKQREIIEEYIKDMEDVYAVDFHKPGPDDNTVRFMEFASTQFNSALHTGAAKAAKKAVQDYLKNRSGVITAQLKELGLEE